MADETITPDALELAVAQPAVTLPGAIHTQSVTTFALDLTLAPSKAICSFPVIASKPEQEGFTDEKDPEAVLVASTASGYPLLNKLFTFDPRTFSFELRAVVEADKLIVMAFYEQHKDVAFPWYNYQDHTTYEVCFASKPGCRLDGRRDLWSIDLELRQTSPSTS